MLIIHKNLEWNIPTGSFLQMMVVAIKWERNEEGESKIIPIRRWVDVFGLFEKVSTISAISRILTDSNDKYYFRIKTPAGAIIDHDNTDDGIISNERLHCTVGNSEYDRARSYYPNEDFGDIECAGYVNEEGRKRLCDKCRTEYYYSHSERCWKRGQIESRGVVHVPTIEREDDGYIDKINEKANQFKMVSTGSKTVDDQRIRNWSNLPKPVNMDTKGITFDNGAYREIGARFIGDNKVEILWIGIMEIEPSIGDDMIMVENSKVRLKKYSGTLPTESTYYDLAGYMEEKKIKPITRKCARGQCNNNLLDNHQWSRLGYCSQRCHTLETERYNKKNMKHATKRWGKGVKGMY